MKKIRFVYASDTIDGRVEEIREFDDNVSEEIIQAEYNCWLDEQCTNYWEEIE